jgi:hypothetical protein
MLASSRTRSIVELRHDRAPSQAFAKVLQLLLEHLPSGRAQPQAVHPVFDPVARAGEFGAASAFSHDTPSLDTIDASIMPLSC